MYRRDWLVVVLLLTPAVSGCGGRVHTGPTPTPRASGTVTVTRTPSPTPTTNPIQGLPVDATVSLAGLPASVDVVIDELGMPHIFGNDRESVLFTQGYLTAASRFWSMDAFRRVGEGRLSELFGAITLPTDVSMRTQLTTRDGRRLEEALWQHLQAVDPAGARLLQAYSDGVNAWLADLRAGRNGATLPPEYGLFLINLSAADLEPWRPQDILAIARLQAFSLSISLTEELNRARIFEQLPEALRRDVFRSAPAAPATVLPVAGGGGAAAGYRAALLPKFPPEHVLRDVVDLLTQVAAASPFGSPETGLGSNNWIVAPERSANGFAMLANDPHLGLFNPPIWFMQQLTVDNGRGERDSTIGVNFPGLPGVILGHNEYGAWGATVAVFDVTDAYVETVTTPPGYPASPRTVLFKGEQVPVLRLEERFGLKGGSSVTHVIEVVPHHGPMVPDPNLNDAVVGLAATRMSFRWTGHEITNDVRFLLDLNLARNVGEFKAAVRHFAVGAQNWVWADVNGDIAYFPFVLVPQRPVGAVPFLPLPGTGEAEWLADPQGRTLWLPEEKFPQATNPSEGFLATSNNDQIGNTLDDDPLDDEIYLTFSADLGFRQERIHELLRNSAGERVDARISAEDMARYQYDHVSKEAERLVPFLLQAAENRPELISSEMAGALARLVAWGERKAGSPPYDMVSGVDAASLRDDIPPRRNSVSAEERADAVAASIFAVWTTRLVPRTFADDFADTGIGTPGGADATKALLHLLEHADSSDPAFLVRTKGANGQSTLWDDRRTEEVESRDEVLLMALQEALPSLASQFQTPEPASWQWGLVHQVRFQHFFGQAGIPFFDLGPFAASGGRFTVDPANFSATGSSFVFTGGASQRFVAVLDPSGIRAVNVIPGGQNGNPGGEGADNYGRVNTDLHYGEFAPQWINGETFAYHFAPTDVAARSVRRVRYVP